MQLTQPVQILAVEGRNVNTKRGPGTVFDVKASDGNTYTTFDAPTAQKAQASLGVGAVTLGYEQTQNGQYTNLNLKEVVGGDVIGDVATPLPLAPAPVPALTQPVTINGTPVAIPVAPLVDPSAKDAKITRLAAQKTAFAFASQLVRDDLDTAAALARKLTDELVVHAHTGQWPGHVTKADDPAGITW